ncbi:MAG: hypothetical protein FJ276_09070 [Planctomycetes bacterium]|nr:hypothetical protein [Planctomycetota bacterium]
MLLLSEVLAAVELCEQEHVRWEHEANPRVLTRMFNGRYVKELDAEVEQSLESLLEFVAEPEVQREAMATVRAVDAFGEIYRKWKQECLNPTSNTHPGGSKELWDAWTLVLQTTGPRRFAVPEPIEQLMSLRTPPRPEQVAKMYQWYRDDGEPDVERVHREIKNPGREYDPETWVDPKKEAYWQEMESYFAARAARLACGETAGSSGKPRILHQEARESLEELLTLPGMTIGQIQKMKPGLTKEAIYVRANELGIVLDEGSPVYVNQRMAQIEASEAHKKMQAIKLRRQQEATAQKASLTPTGQNEAEAESPSERRGPRHPAETHAEMLDDVTARVLAMADEGLRPGQIAAALATKMPNSPTASQVGRILREHGAQ